jgi:Rho GDP-dissociation inhibitor
MEGAAIPPAGKPDGDEVDFEAGDGFTAPKQVDLATLVSKDAGDESLQKYKASLLGSAAAGATAADAETRRVVIHELRISVADRPDIVLPLDTPERVRAVEGGTLIVKEGLAFNTRLVWSVHKDVVLGLKFAQKVTRMGMTVDRFVPCARWVARRGCCIVSNVSGRLWHCHWQCQ